MTGLEWHGVRFLRADGALVWRTPPGHSRPRSIPTDSRGYRGYTHHPGALRHPDSPEIAQERAITILSEMPVVRLLVREGAVHGALGINSRSGGPVLLLARAVILAAGSGGQIFANTNDTSDTTGDSYALALEAGVPLRDMEFVQFYPTMMPSPAHATAFSPLFGEGAVLRNLNGERFMLRYDPANADMATRDVMSRGSSGRSKQTRAFKEAYTWTAPPSPNRRLSASPPRWRTCCVPTLSIRLGTGWWFRPRPTS